MSLETALFMAFALAVFAATPGPGIAATLARALGRGFWPCVPLVMGMVIGDVIFLLAAVYGLNALATEAGGVFAVLKWVGAAYLIYLGIRLWLAAPVPVDTEAAPKLGKAESPAVVFGTGVLISLSNPKVILFYGSVLASLIDVAALSDADKWLLAGLTLVAVPVPVLAYAAAASRARRLFTKPENVRRLNRVAGTTLVGAGAALAAR